MATTQEAGVEKADSQIEIELKEAEINMGQLVGVTGSLEKRLETVSRPTEPVATNDLKEGWVHLASRLTVGNQTITAIVQRLSSLLQRIEL